MSGKLMNINLLNSWFKLWEKQIIMKGLGLDFTYFYCLVLDAVGGFVEKSSFVLVVNTKSLVEVDLLE